MKKTILQIVLLVVIIALAYLVYRSISGPVEYNSDKKLIQSKVIERMKEIRELQVNYKNVYGMYADNFDKLINFYNEENFPVVNKKSTLPDSLSEISEEEAIKLGYITLDTVQKPVRDSLFKDKFVDIQDPAEKEKAMAEFIKNIQYIPYLEKKAGKPSFVNGEKFQIQAGEVTKGQVKVSVFEVVALNEHYLKGLDEELVAKEEKDALRMGSMTDPSTDGNWE